MQSWFMGPASPSRSERARQRLLAAALKVFGEKGPRGASVREITRAAGQNVAAVAYYFGSKQKLYEAVMEGIVRELRGRLGEVLGEAQELQRSGEHSPGKAARLLKGFLVAVYARLLSRDDAVPIVQLIVREQLTPTAGFEVLYHQGFRDLHETLCCLVGMCLGRDPRDRETIVRTHTLMGQVYFFAMSREAILRRLGWKSLEGRNTDLVVRVIEGNLDKLLAAPRRGADKRG